jgi:hypothetical protein
MTLFKYPKKGRSMSSSLTPISGILFQDFSAGDNYIISDTMEEPDAQQNYRITVSQPVTFAYGRVTSDLYSASGPYAFMVFLTPGIDSAENVPVHYIFTNLSRDELSRYEVYREFDKALSLKFAVFGNAEVENVFGNPSNVTFPNKPQGEVVRGSVIEFSVTALNLLSTEQRWSYTLRLDPQEIRQPPKPVLEAVSGGPDVSTISLDLAFRGTTIESGQAGPTEIYNSERGYSLSSVEIVKFHDGRLVFSETDPAAQATRLYQAALGRLPDQAGLNFWIEKLEAGESLPTLARGFLDSDEFNARFGGLSDGDFVERMYLNVLGRGSDAVGQAGWINYLQSGQGRDWVLQGFSESAENKARTAPLVQAGIWDLDEHAAQATRLYDTVLGRRPDEAGLAVQRGALDAGTSLETLANNFVASAEFQAIYGQLDDRGFVTALYQNTLDRLAEPAGLEFWVNHLRSGMSRSEVVLGFSESAEHVALTKPFIMSENPAEFGIAFA